MKLNRRDVIASLAASFAMPRLAFSQNESGYFVLTAEKAVVPLLGKGSPRTPVWRFMKEQPVAVLRAKQGQSFKGRFINKLDQDVWLHWFGVRGNTEAMTINATPSNGNSVDIDFTPPDAGTFWFGPLLHASEQRDMGLYGMLIVEEATPLELTDVPLVIDDWMIDDKGQTKGAFGDLDAAIGEGRLGNWFTLNGSVKSRFQIEGAKPTRFRVLNAANARTMNIQFKGAEPDLIALDGQPIVPRPLGADSLKLVPGQRADVLLSGFKGQVTIAIDAGEDAADLGFFDIAGSPPLPASFALPPNPLPNNGDLTLAREVPIKIEGGAKGGLKSAKVGDVELDLRGLLVKGLAWAMNGIAGVGGPTLFEAKKGETVVLAIENLTSFPQPLHVHGHVWQMVETDGVKVEKPIWSDTAIVPGLAKVKLVLVADNLGLWVVQSLIAERSDAGLIGAFTVAEMP